MMNPEFYLIVIVYLLELIYFIGKLIGSYKSHSLISPFNYAVVLYFLMPMLLIFPFSFSEANAITIGEFNYYKYLPHIRTVLNISVIGTLFFSVSYELTTRSGKVLMFDRVSRGIFGLCFSLPRYLLYMGTIGILGLVLIFTSHQYGGYIGIRGNVQGSSLIQLIYNVFTSVYPLVAFSILIKCINKPKQCILWGIIFLLIGFSTGSRTVMITPILYFLLSIVGVKQKITNKNKLYPIIIITFILIISVMLFYSSQRNNLFQNEKVYFNLLFGNTFSDFRDTAWILSGLNGTYTFGKTYLAALLSFIPSSMSGFKSDWVLGSVTNRMAGIESTTHPGLRPIIFGEAYINFSYFGVIIFGIIFGYLVANINNYFINYSTKKNYILTGFSFVLLNLAHYLMISAGFFTVYLQILVLLMWSITFDCNTYEDKIINVQKQ